jgi:hypothetical protein
LLVAHGYQSEKVANGRGCRQRMFGTQQVVKACDIRRRFNDLDTQLGILHRGIEDHGSSPLFRGFGLAFHRGFGTE